MATRFASVISKEIAHYSPKWRWLAVTIYLAASRLGKQPPHAISTSVKYLLITICFKQQCNF